MALRRLSISYPRRPSHFRPLRLSAPFRGFVSTPDPPLDLPRPEPTGTDAGTTEEKLLKELNTIKWEVKGVNLILDSIKTNTSVIHQTMRLNHSEIMENKARRDEERTAEAKANSEQNLKNADAKIDSLHAAIYLEQLRRAKTFTTVFVVGVFGNCLSIAFALGIYLASRT